MTLTGEGDGPILAVCTNPGISRCCTARTSCAACSGTGSYVENFRVWNARPCVIARSDHKAIDPFRWALSRGRQPIVRAVPATRLRGTGSS